MKTVDAVAFFGTKKAIATACTDDGWSLTAAAVSQWGEEPPAGRQRQLEALSQGALKARASEVAPESAVTATKHQNDIEHKETTETETSGTDDMIDSRIEDLNIESISTLITPQQLKEEMPISETAIASVQKGRQAVRDILDRKDHRIFLVVGPCSIHDVDAAKEYAEKLRDLAEEVSDTLYLVMRVYFEKPRTTVGWKGLINDPYMNDTFKIQDGLHIARRLLIDLAEYGLPLSTEALDPISPQYLQDLIAWSAIGARTTESQTHREMASGLSSAVGFKNGTDGSLTVATNALMSVANPHRFLGMNQSGQVSIVETAGNPYAHVVLRGGGGKPNYDSVNVKIAEEALAKADLAQNIMVDCSHENSNKNPALQPLVMDNVTNQILEGNDSIIGLMIESNLKHGRQNIPANLDDLEYGLSVTDGCISWEETAKAIRNMRDKLKDVLPKRGK